MRILLSAANFCSDPYPVYPLGMSVIAAAAEQILRLWLAARR